MGIKELKKKKFMSTQCLRNWEEIINVWSLSKHVNSYLVSMKGNPFSMHLFLIVNAAFNECLLCISMSFELEGLSEPPKHGGVSLVTENEEWAPRLDSSFSRRILKLNLNLHQGKAQSIIPRRNPVYTEFR